MKSRPIKDYFNQYNKVAVLLISTIFTLMLGVYLLSEVQTTSKELINYQVQVKALESNSFEEFQKALAEQEYYKNIKVKLINKEINREGLISGILTNSLIVSINNQGFVVTFEHNYLTTIMQKFIIVVLFSVFGAYGVLNIFNKAKVESLSKQVGQLFSSVEKLSNKRSKVIASEVSEFQELQDLLRDADSSINSERVALKIEAEEDHLTKMLNRKAFDKQMEFLESTSQSDQKAIGLLFFDLNNFKIMNDTHGHDFGDEILIEFAKKLKGNVRDNDLAYRIGGDEFAVLVQYTVAIEEDVEDLLLQKMNNLRELLVSRLNNQANIQGKSIPLSCSIGIGLYPYNVNKISELKDFADKDMYEHKKLTKGLEKFTSFIKAV